MTDANPPYDSLEYWKWKVDVFYMKYDNLEYIGFRIREVLLMGFRLRSTFPGLVDHICYRITQHPETLACYLDYNHMYSELIEQNDIWDLKFLESQSWWYTPEKTKLFHGGPNLTFWNIDKFYNNSMNATSDIIDRL